MKVTKTNVKAITQELKKLDEMRVSVEEKVEEIRDTIHNYSVFQEFLDEREEWDEQREKIQGLLDDMCDDMEGIMAERSEKWQESEKAEQAQALVDAWRELLDEVPESVEDCEVELVVEGDIIDEIDVDSILPSPDFNDY